MHFCFLITIFFLILVNYQEMLGFWSDVYGYKMTCLAKEVIKEALVSTVPSNTIATSQAQVLNLDLYTADVAR